MHRICVIEMPHETLTVAVNGRCQQNSTWRTCSCWKGHHYILSHSHHDFIVVLAIHTAAGVSWDWLLLGRQHSSILQLILSFINQALYMCLFILHLLPESTTSQDAPNFSTGRSDYHYPYKGGSLQWGVPQTGWLIDNTTESWMTGCMPQLDLIPPVILETPMF